MTNEAKQALEALLPGQLWKTENSYILITDHGKRLVGYKKMHKPVVSKNSNDRVRHFVNKRKSPGSAEGEETA